MTLPAVLARTRGALAVVVCALAGHAVLYRSLWPADGVHGYFGWYEPAVGVLSAASALAIAVLLVAGFAGRSSRWVQPLRTLLRPGKAGPSLEPRIGTLAWSSLVFLLTQESLERSVQLGRPAFALFAPSAWLLLLAALAAFSAILVSVTRSCSELFERLLARPRVRIVAALASSWPPGLYVVPAWRSVVAGGCGLRGPPALRT